MSVKRFVAADMRRALELVREEMGADAIILSSKRTKGGVEILTTSEPELETPASFMDQAAAASQAFATASAASPAAQPSQPASVSRGASYRFEPPTEQPARQQQRAPLPQADIPQAEAQALSAASLVSSMPRQASSSLQLANWQYEPGPTQVAFHVDPNVWNKPRNDAPVAPQDDFFDDQFNELRAEIMGMRELLQSQLSQWSQGPQAAGSATSAELPSTVATVIQRRLVQMGLPAPQIKQCLARLNPRAKLADGWAEVLAYLAHRLPISTQDAIAQGGIYAFVGAVGAGKTATIAKLAARQVLKAGPQGIALVCATARGESSEQLQRLGRILNVPVYQVDGQHSLQAILNQLGDKTLVLIDTPAPATDTAAANQLKQLRHVSGVRVKTYWVVAADSSEPKLRQLANRYGNGRLAGCVLTRLDRASRLGPVLGSLLASGVAISYTSHGPAMPQDIQVARAHQLVTKAVSLLKTQGQRDSASRAATTTQQATGPRGMAVS